MKKNLFLYALAIIILLGACDELELANEKLSGRWEVVRIEYNDTLYCDSCATEMQFQHCANTVKGCKFTKYLYIDTLVIYHSGYVQGYRRRKTYLPGPNQKQHTQINQKRPCVWLKSR